MIATGLATLSALSLSAAKSVPASGTPRGGRPAAQTFGDQEAANQWYRTGKDSARWKPGDSTGDRKDDERLLWSSWKLDPPQLHVPEGSIFCDCTLVRIVLSHLGFPFVVRLVGLGDAGADDGDTEDEDDLFGPEDDNLNDNPFRGDAANFLDAYGDADARDVPVLKGTGLPPVDVLCGTMQICSYAASVVRDGRLAPATNREDVGVWLDTVAEFVLETDECVPELVSGLAHQLRPMLRGVDAEGVATVNQWGFCMDDAMVVASLHALAGFERRGPEGSRYIPPQGESAPDSWPESVRDFLEVNLARAGVPIAGSY